LGPELFEATDQDAAKMKFSRRDWMAGGAALMVSAAAVRAAPGFAADSTRKLPLTLVHPELRGMVPLIEKELAGLAALSPTTLAAARKPNPNPLFNSPPLDDVMHEARVIPVGKPHPDVTIYVINAKPGSSRPAILHTHGGGYVLGSAKSDIRRLQELCKLLDCVAVSVEYRLAPETTYAGSIEDNYAGLKWLHANAAALGADPSRIAVMGESAGGGHAALLAITARDRGEVPLCFQCLIYPMLDDRTGSTRAVLPHVGTLIWTPPSNRFGWESFLGTVPGRASAPKGAVPARVADLKGLPPAFIGVGTLDLFLDEDINYAQRLNAAAVVTELVVVPGAFHGFDAIGAALPVAKAFNVAKLNALRRGFGLPPAA
jgi:acetyl esterase/lipase